MDVRDTLDEIFDEVDKDKSGSVELKEPLECNSGRSAARAAFVCVRESV